MERSEIQEAGVSPDSALLHLGYVVASLHSFSVDTAVACAVRTSAMLKGCSSPQKGGCTMAEPGVFEIIYSTRAMRRLKPDPIPEETLKKIVDAGTRAASGGNTQEWAFVLVR